MLIEVTAGLALLAALLVSLLVARQRHLHQWAAASRKLEAVHAAEDLLNSLWPPHHPTPQGISDGRTSASIRLGDNPLASPHTIREAGTFDNGLAWRLTQRSDRAAEAWGARVVRLEITDERDEQSEDRVLVTVDLLIPAGEQGGLR